MIYRPEKGAMWDPSVIWHDGKYYAFMMYNKDGREGLKAKHCLLASSTDGVHWKDEGIVNEERESARGCRFFKCFVGTSFPKSKAQVLAAIGGMWWPRPNRACPVLQG
jgi:hypothetical protein